ncbi:MAG: two pore domain potassium channel family protein [Pseudomonadales bacterium]|nr:two pore domain potassium channel family protein [Pseudomonadales bacterium]
MLLNIFIGSAIMVLCLMLQIVLIIATFRYYVRHRNLINHNSPWKDLRLLSIVMLLLVLGNVGQIAIWALLFRLLGEFQQFNLAFYHSAVNFASLGYGDIVMSDRHKLLGALEALNGVLMIGVSTAALMGPFKDALKKAGLQ